MTADETRDFEAVLWDIASEVVRAPTRREIDERVCERLRTTGRYDTVWTASPPPDASPRVVDGDDATVERVHASFERADATPPWVEAVEERDGVVRAVPRDGSALTLGSVPLQHRRINYAVLNVGCETRPAADVRADVTALSEFGSVVGHALATTEMQTHGETFRQAIEQADPAIAILDPDGTVEYVNAAFGSVFGYDKSETIGAPLADILSGVPDGVVDEVARTPHWRDEVVCRRKDGGRVHIDLSIATIPIEGGTRHKYVAVGSDITSLKEHQQRIEVLNRVLRHNLRNDLGVARGHIAYVRRTVDSAHVRSSLDTAIENIDSLIDIGDKARYVEEHVGRATDGDVEPVDAVETVRRVLDRFEREHPETDVRLSAPETCRVLGNAPELAIRELLSNAVEHNDSETARIEVRISPDAGPDGLAEIVVADDGPGIPETEREVLQKGRETDLTHGSSLGLWLVTWLVRSAGGRLSVGESRLGGAAVNLYLRTDSTD